MSPMLNFGLLGTWFPPGMNYGVYALIIQCAVPWSAKIDGSPFGWLAATPGSRRYLQWSLALQFHIAQDICVVALNSRDTSSVVLRRIKLRCQIGGDHEKHILNMLREPAKTLLALPQSLRGPLAFLHFHLQLRGVMRVQGGDRGEAGIGRSQRASVRPLTPRKKRRT
jgi:hypothetical protein